MEKNNIETADTKEITIVDKEKEATRAKQDKLIPFLLTENSIDAACKKAGIGAATYYRWLSDRAFVIKFRDARNVILENTVTRLQTLSGDAVETLRKNLSCGNPAAENKAAQLILLLTVKGVETLDIIGKLEAVQKMLENEREHESRK